MDEEIFPPHIIARRHLVLFNSASPDTLQKYATGVVRFTKFCDDFDVSEHERMPASEGLLELFITTRGAYHVGKETMENWVQGLELWHMINGAPWNGSKGLKRAIEGSAKCAPGSETEPKRDPVTLQHLQALSKNLDLSNAFDSAVFAVACIAFWCCCRLGELVIESTHTDFDPSHQISRSADIRRVDSNGIRYSIFHLRNTKDKRLKGDDVDISDAACPCSAYTALEHHLKTNSKVPAEAPLFSFETTDGKWAPMQRNMFVGRCSEVWEKEGLGSRKGLSFRIGGTTHLLLLGIDPWVVSLLSRRSSQGLLAYWVKCEEILPLVMGFQLKAYSSVLTTMSVFKSRLAGKEYPQD